MAGNDRPRRPAFRPARLARASVGLLFVTTLVLSALAPFSPARAPPPATGVGLSLTASPTNGTAPLAVGFVATLTPATTQAAFNWSFGDGEYYNLSANGTSQPVHTYSTVGTYTAHLSITSPSGNANASLTVTVVAENLVATISASPLNGTAPLTVHFLAAFSGGTGTYESILWSFGNGDSGSGPVLNYTYPVAGTFQVSLTVTDSSGHSVRDQRTIAVTNGTVTSPGSGPGNGLSSWTAYLLVLAVLLAVAAASALWYRAMVRQRASTAEAPPGAVNGAGAALEVADRASPPAAGTSSGWARPEGPMVAAGPGATLDDSLRLSERILIHLFWYGRPGTEGAARAEATQQGMARALNAGQNTISKALSRLRDAGAVRVELQHVPGAPRRVKTYSLTSRGEAVARSLTRTLGEAGASQSSG